MGGLLAIIEKIAFHIFSYFASTSANPPSPPASLQSKQPSTLTLTSTAIPASTQSSGTLAIKNNPASNPCHWQLSNLNGKNQSNKTPGYPPTSDFQSTSYKPSGMAATSIPQSNPEDPSKWENYLNSIAGGGKIEETPSSTSVTMEINGDGQEQVIVPHSQMTRYNNTTLATGALHQQMTANRDALNQICHQLPPDSEAAIQFLVSTDSNESNAKIYHTATIHIAHSSQGKRMLSATIATYGKSEATKTTSSNSKTLSTDTRVLPMDSLGQKIGHHLIIPTKGDEIKKIFNSMEAGRRCPQAFAIQKIIYQIFKKGILLPSNQEFHYTTLNVMVKTYSHHLPHLLRANFGIRGTHDSRGIDGNWIGVVVEENADPRKFQEMVGATKGQGPKSIPSTAQAIDWRTMSAEGTLGRSLNLSQASGSLLNPPSSSGVTIEEVE